MFSTWPSTFHTNILAIERSFDVEALNQKNPHWTLAFLTYYFLAIPAFFLFGFLAIAIHAYFEVELLAGSGFAAERWGKQEWLAWLLWRPIYERFFQKEDSDDD